MKCQCQMSPVTYQLSPAKFEKCQNLDTSKAIARCNVDDDRNRQNKIEGGVGMSSVIFHLLTVTCQMSVFMWKMILFLLNSS